MEVYTATELLIDAKAETSEKKRPQKFYHASMALFKAGELNKALGCLEEIKDPTLFIKLITDEFVFYKLFEKGETGILITVTKEATEKLNNIQDENIRIDLTLKIAENWFRLGHTDTALLLINDVNSTIKKLHNGKKIDYFKIRLVELYSKLEAYTTARSILKQVNDEELKSLGLLYIVKQFVANSKLDDAILIANEIPNKTHRSNAFVYIAVGYLNEKNIHGATKVVDLIENPQWNERIKFWLKKYSC
ncbi:MAG: hypothetical protein ACTSQY_11040 [Candidatus Odinarchaeia archaeon]